MIRNARNNQFVFKFPPGFLYPEIKQKYDYYLTKVPTPFRDMSAYLNHKIQGVNFPAVASGSTEQILDKVPQYWRQSFDFTRVLTKEFTVDLKTTDGFLNYWVMLEQYKAYLTWENMDDYFPDMNIIFLDRFGYQLVTITFKDVMMIGIDALDMSYAASGFDFKTFGVTFKYSDFAIDVKLD